MYSKLSDRNRLGYSLNQDSRFKLAPKTFQVLLVLVRRSREVVTKDDLMKTVWPDTFVEETKPDPDHLHAPQGSGRES